MKKGTETKYILLIFVAICFLATGGIFVKLSSLPPINTGFYRVLFSIPILFPFVTKDIKNIKNIDMKDIILIFFAGFFLAGDLILWNISFKYTSVANANLLANLVPLTMIPVSFFIFKEKITSKFFIGLIVTLTGVIILVKGRENPLPSNFFGDFLAFLTSILYAGFLLTVYKVRDRVNAFLIMFVSAFGSILVIFISMYFIEGIYIPSTTREIVPLICLALFSQIMGQGLLSFCLGNVRASLSSILVLFQPVIAALYSFILFKEKLTWIEMLGILITIFGVYISKRAVND